MNRLPSGLYRPGGSFIHRLDAAAKILCLFLLLAAVVSTTTPAGYGAWVLFLAVLVRLAGVGFRAALGPAARLKWFFILILLMNLCFYGPEQAWVRIWIFQPSPAGLMQGLHVAARVFLLLVMSNVLMISTEPLAVTAALERLLSPLRFIGVPVDLTAMILSAAIQFIPALLEETDSIRRAQTARGARFDSPRLLEKGKAVLPLLVPVFLAAFQRADELSLAMEARGYRTDVRRSRKSYPPFKAADWLALGLCAAGAAVFIAVR